MNDASRRTIFAIFAILAVSAGVAYAAATGAAPARSPGIARAIPSAAVKADALALDDHYGCAPSRRGEAAASARAVRDCD